MPRFLLWSTALSAACWGKKSFIIATISRWQWSICMPLILRRPWIACAASLKRFAAHHGVTGLYHETLTRFWLLQVDRRLDRSGCLSESVRKIREQLNDKNLVFDYYSRERIESKEARETWLMPDLKEQ